MMGDRTSLAGGDCMWGHMMRALFSSALVLGFLVAGQLPAQSETQSGTQSDSEIGVPQVETLQMFARFTELSVAAPEQAFAIADELLKITEDDDLRLTFAQAAMQAGAPERAIAYVLPLAEQLEPTDPRLTRALDLLVVAHEAIGDVETALAYELLAYNSAEARLGAQNMALLPRLQALEPKVAELNPALMAPLQQMRAALTAPSAKSSLRAEGDPTAVTVWFGTNRVATGATDPALAFGSDLGELTVGTLTVTIPPTHLSGLIERPTGWFFTEHLDPEKHVVLAGIDTLNQAAFGLGCCGAEDRLLFVHGYNVTFHDGALRAAQLAFDLEFPGKSMYYSWPSKASLYGYLTDANNVVPSRPAMETFLEIATRGEGKLHILAHSMGNRYLLEALETFLLRHPDRRVGQLVLAAPDVDRAEFAARFGVIREKVDGITLYASRNDMALQVSRRVNGGYRLGDANGEVVRLAGLDTVDASLIEADTLGHSYFGDAPQLLGDILGLVRLGWQPQDRCGVAPRETDAVGSIWEVKPDGCPVEEVRTAGDLIRIYGGSALVEAERLMDNAGGDRLDFWQGVMAVVRARLDG